MNSSGSRIRTSSRNASKAAATISNFSSAPTKASKRARKTEQSFGDQPFGTREPQPYIPPTAQPFVQRDNQPYQPREQRDAQPIEQRPQPRAPQPEPGNESALPAFITGGAPVPPAPQGQNGNGFENGGQPDRFPLHRRRRRHRGPRDQAGPQGGDRPDDSGPPGQPLRAAPPAEGASTGSSAGTSRRRSRRAGIAR